MDTSKTNKQIIHEHLLRYYYHCQDMGNQVVPQVTEEYSVYFENMFNDLYIKHLELKLSQKECCVSKV